MRKRCLQIIYELAKKDPRIVFVGSDLGSGVLDEFKEEMPDRFFMEGISEQHVIGMAAGLAKEGFIPYVNTIATFITRRCYEQVAIDLCLQNLPVRLIGNGGGYVYAPLGPTHQAVEDIAIMRALPNMTIIAPSDAHQMEGLMRQTVDVPGPVYVRVAKGYDPIVTEHIADFPLGKATLMFEPESVLIVATGIMLQRALEVREQLSRKNIKAGVLNVHTIKPLDDEVIIDLASKVKTLVIMEEHTKVGGLSSAILETLIDNRVSPLPQILRKSLPDEFSSLYGSQNQLLDNYGLDADSITQEVLSIA